MGLPMILTKTDKAIASSASVVATPMSKEHLQITGKRLNDGLDITDYKITIGIGICTMVDLTANEQICEIPEEKDQQEKDGHSVLVHPGTNLSPQLIGTVHLLISTNFLMQYRHWRCSI